MKPADEPEDLSSGRQSAAKITTRAAVLLSLAAVVGASAPLVAVSGGPGVWLGLLLFVVACGCAAYAVWTLSRWWRGRR